MLVAPEGRYGVEHSAVLRVPQALAVAGLVMLCLPPLSEEDLLFGVLIQMAT